MKIFSHALSLILAVCPEVLGLERAWGEQQRYGFAGCPQHGCDVR